MLRVGPSENSPWRRARIPGPAGALLVSCLLVSCISDGEPASESRPIRAAAAEANAEERKCPVATKVRTDLTLIKACSPYVLKGGGMDIIDGATLTIEPGVEVRFRGSDWLEVGAGGQPGRLIAKGTREEPIVFSIGQASEGDGWLGVWFHSGTLPGSVLSHAVVRDAGGLDPLEKPPLPLGCVSLTGVKPGALTIGDVRVERCKYGGLRMTNSHVQLGALSFFDMNEGFNVDVASLGQITQVAEFQQVARNVIRGGSVSADATWIAQPVPYVVEGDIVVGGPSEPRLTLGAGLELGFAKSRELVVGAEQPGGIIAAGTKERPIKLSASESGAPWGGLRLMQHTSAGTRLSFVEVGHAQGEAAVAVHSKSGRVEIGDSTFLENKADVLIGCGAAPVLGKNRYGSSNKPSRAERCK